MEREKNQRKQIRRIDGKDNLLQHYLLSDEKMLMGSVVRDEMMEIKEKYSDERRTKMVADNTEIAEEDLIEKVNVAVTLTHLGYVKRTG